MARLETMPALLPMRKDAAAPALQQKINTTTKENVYSSVGLVMKTISPSSTYKNTVSGPTISAHQVVQADKQLGRQPTHVSTSMRTLRCHACTLT